MQKVLDADTIRALLKTAPLEKRETVYRTPVVTCNCGSTLSNGYCRNDECPVDTPVATLDCDICGNCSNPGKCVASVVCPTCTSAVGNLCLDARGGYTGYHEERWLMVKEDYGVYYR